MATDWQAPSAWGPPPRHLLSRLGEVSPGQRFLCGGATPTRGKSRCPSPKFWPLTSGVLSFSSNVPTFRCSPRCNDCCTSSRLIVAAAALAQRQTAKPARDDSHRAATARAAMPLHLVLWLERLGRPAPLAHTAKLPPPRRRDVHEPARQADSLDDGRRFCDQVGEVRTVCSYRRLPLRPYELRAAAPATGSTGK
jgi:hypothetical protein